MVALLDGRALQRVAGHLGAALLFVGDSAQLPPVGAAPGGSGQQMALTDSWIKTAAELKTVRRNCGAILELANRLRTRGNVALQWPATTQLDPGGESGIVVHDSLEDWTLAAAAVLAAYCPSSMRFWARVRS